MRFAAFLLFVAAPVCAKRAYCRLKRGGLDAQLPLPLPTSPATSGPPGSATSTSSGVAPTQTTLPPFDYQTDVVRGVNLGGWFVMEPWITPSMFINTGNDDVVDEYTFGQLQDPDVALAALTTHWQTWITEQDFADIAAAGLNHVRLPLGFWAVPLNRTVAPYVPGAYPYFKTALGWAAKHGIYVILDLHGAPGSQNGYDNSGQRTGNPQWAVNDTYVQWTLDVISFLSKDVGSQVAAVELINEAAAYLPPSTFPQTVRQYYLDGYAAVRSAAGATVQVMIGDAFLGVDSWENFMQPPQYNNVLMDTHEYQIFSIQELQRSFDAHVQFACGLADNYVPYSQGNVWTIMGEWSTASTDCTKWLNGRGVGARWDGTYYAQAQVLGTCSNMTGSASNFSDEYKTFLRQYWEAQVDVGEQVKGWIMWTWKAENSDDWSYQVGLREGWIPQDPSQRMYPNLCSGSSRRRRRT